MLHPSDWGHGLSVNGCGTVKPLNCLTHFLRVTGIIFFSITILASKIARQLVLEDYCATFGFAAMALYIDV